MSQLLFKNVTVVERSGGPRFSSSVLVSGGKVKDIGEFSDSVTEQTIDVRDLGLCPGFVDMHKHPHIWFHSNPRQKSKIMQGVPTTKALGQEGGSCAPASKSTETGSERSLSLADPA